MELILALIILTLLIFINAIYVASEFATVSAQKSRFAILAEENETAKTLLDIVENAENLDQYIATAQVGITITSFVLGFFGQDKFAVFLTPLIESAGINSDYAQSISTTIILVALTLIQVLFGELIPKNIGILIPEQLAIATNLPMRISSIILRPIILILNGTSKFILKIFGLNSSMENNHIFTASEISIIAQNSSEAGIIARQETQLLTAALESHYATAKEIMVPRIKIEAISINTKINIVLEKLLESTKSRFLVYQDSMDNVVGAIHIKDLIKLDLLNELPESIEPILRPVIFIPDSMNTRNILNSLQTGKNQVAVVIDEYGGTAGMITVEDLVEEIFGEIADEFDFDEENSITQNNQGIFLIQGQTRIKEVEELIGIDLPVEHSETISGFMLEKFGKIPQAGERIEFNSIYLDVLKMDENTILTIEIGTTNNPNINQKEKNND